MKHKVELVKWELRKEFRHRTGRTDYHIHAETGESIAVLYDIDNPEKEESNARLIASAPELLEALKEVFEEINLADTGLDLYIKVKQAIKKAEG